MSMPASRAPKIVLIRRRVRTIGAAPVAADSVVGASNCTPQGKGGAAGAAPIERPAGARCFSKADDGVRGRSGTRRGGQACGECVPRLVEEIGERGGEVAGEPAVQRGAQGDACDAGQQGGMDVDAG